MTIPTTHLVLLVAAVARLAMLVANEDGPYLMFRKLRRKVETWEKKYRWFRRGYWSTGLGCEKCNSIWFGSFFAGVYALVPNLALVLAFPLALSMGAILIKYVLFTLQGLDTRLDQLNNPKPTEVKAVKTSLIENLPIEERR